jgi:peptide/nickel transport system permease protein
LIAVFLAASIYAVFTYPYRELEQLWNPGLSQYKTRPTLARPLWFNWFLQHDLPENVIIDSRDHPELKKATPNSSNGENVSITYSFYMPDGDFPQDIFLYFHTQIKEKEPFASFTWITPDRREFHLKNSIVVNSSYYDFSDNIPTRYLDSRYIRHNLVQNQGGASPHKALFADPSSTEIKPVSGTYQLRVDIVTFEPDSRVDMEFVLLGEAFGWAGTDHLRRELSIGLLWGLPVALSIGLLGALTTSVLAMLIAAGAAWNGGWVDALIQRLTELNMILPILAVGVLLSIHFDVSIWTVLLIAILLNAFGSTTRGYRAAFLQAKEAPYVEAARAYGASDLRIITKYLIPRIFPVMIPQVVMLIPGYVFLEATLAIFGVSTPYAPTWGRIIFDALSRGVHNGNYYWILEPVSLLLVTSLAFAMLGYTLDRVLNPRLRSEGAMMTGKPMTRQGKGRPPNLNKGTVGIVGVALLLVALLVSSIQNGKLGSILTKDVNDDQEINLGTPNNQATFITSFPTVTPASPAGPFPALTRTPAASATPPLTPAQILNELTAAPSPIGAGPASYTVQKGEYPYCLARRFNVDPNELLALNGLSDQQTFFVGTVLQLPHTGKPFPRQRMLQVHPTTYIVSGTSETIYTIACAFGDLDPIAIAQANNLAIDSPLFPGQQLNIP